MGTKKSREPDKMITTRVTKALPVNLTDDEVLKYGRDIARAHAERDNIASRAKSVAKDYASKVSEQDAIIGKLSPRVHSGIETRDVECEEIKNWTAATVTITRLDTGEVIESRPMREDEKEMQLSVASQSGDATE